MHKIESTQSLILQVGSSTGDEKYFWLIHFPAKTEPLIGCKLETYPAIVLHTEIVTKIGAIQTGKQFAILTTTTTYSF